MGIIKKLSNFQKGFSSGLLAVLCFSFLVPFGIVIYQNGVSPLSLLIFRAIVAGILITLTIIFSKKLSFKIGRKDWFKVFIYSILLSAYLLLFWKGAQILIHVPTIYAVYFTYPFWTMIFAIIFLKERFNKLKWLSLALGVMGTFFAIGFLPSLSLGVINLYGASLVMLGAIIWGADVLIGQQIFKKYNVITILFYNFIIMFILFSLFQNPLVILSEVNTTSLIYMITVSVISTYLAFIFFSKSIRHFGGSNWGLINLASPFFIGLVAFILLGQVINYYQAFGIILSTLGVYLLYRSKKK